MMKVKIVYSWRRVGGANDKLEGSVFILMMSRNLKGPQDLSKPLTVLLFITSVHPAMVTSIALSFLEACSKVPQYLPDSAPQQPHTGSDCYQ